MASNTDPFYNCINEREMFESLVRCSNSQRILSVVDKSGSGKTQLQHHLRNYCLNHERYELPTHLFLVKSQPDITPFDFISTLKKGLNRWIKFEKFESVNVARLGGDYNSVLSASGKALSLSQVDVRGANFSSAKNTSIVGSQTNFNFDFRSTFSYDLSWLFEEIQKSNNHKLSEEQELQAQQWCIEAFYDDMTAFSRSRKNKNKTIVLLIDGAEAFEERLRLWFFDEFLERCFFDSNLRPKKLVLVITSQQTINWDRPRNLCEELVATMEGSVSKWSLEDVQKCLEQEGASYLDIASHLHEAMQEGKFLPIQLVNVAKALALNGNNNVQS